MPKILFQQCLNYIDTIIAAISAVIAFLTLRNTANIKETVNIRISQEQFWNNKNNLNDKLLTCLNIVQKQKIRPANDPLFTQHITLVLSDLERHFSLDKKSHDYQKLMEVKNQITDLLAVHEVDDIDSDIRKNTGLYGSLIGELQDILNNGRLIL